MEGEITNCNLRKKLNNEQTGNKNRTDSIESRKVSKTTKNTRIIVIPVIKGLKEILERHATRSIRRTEKV